MSFDLGELVPLSVTIRDAAGTPANATSVTATITLPDGTTASSGAVAPTTQGVYDYDYATVQAGRHAVRWVATGANAGAYTDVFEVLPAATVQLISLADAKKHLNIPATKTDDDAEVADFIRSVTAVIERHVGAVARTAWTETHDGGHHEVALRHYPVLSVTSVTVSGTVLTPSDYTLSPLSGVLARTSGYSALSFPPGRANVVVALVAGTVATAPNVAQAVKIILKHMWETQRSAGGRRPPLDGEPVVDVATYAIPYRALEYLGKVVSDIA